MTGLRPSSTNGGWGVSIRLARSSLGYSTTCGLRLGYSASEVGAAYSTSVGYGGQGHSWVTPVGAQPKDS